MLIEHLYYPFLNPVLDADHKEMPIEHLYCSFLNPVLDATSQHLAFDY